MSCEELIQEWKLETIKNMLDVYFTESLVERPRDEAKQRFVKGCQRLNQVSKELLDILKEHW